MLQDTLCTHPELAFINNIMHLFSDSPWAADQLRSRLNLNVSGERYIADSVYVDAESPSDPVATWAKWLKEDLYQIEYKKLGIEYFSGTDRLMIEREIQKILWCYGGQKRLLTKNPALLPHFELLQMLFPDAYFIYLLRDPRMNANSMLKLYRKTDEQRRKLPDNDRRERHLIPYPHLPKLADYVAEFGPNDIRTTAHLWRDSVRFVEQLRPGIRNFYEVRYEDILNNPDNELKKLFEFCDLPIPASDNQRYLERLKGIGQVQHSNDYRDFLQIEEICGDEMFKYGYSQTPS